MGPRLFLCKPRALDWTVRVLVLPPSIPQPGLAPGSAAVSVPGGGPRRGGRGPDALVCPVSLVWGHLVTHSPRTARHLPVHLVV